MRATEQQIDDLLIRKEYDKILEIYAGYIQKYKRILTGHIPDNSEDTRLFLDSDVSSFDIESLLRIYDQINELESIDVVLIRMLKDSIVESSKAWEINFKFRSRVYRWMEELSKKVYEDEI